LEKKMQKKLLALALASLTSSGAFAQVNVTVYGQIDLSINQYSGTYIGNQKNSSGTDTAIQSGVGNASASLQNGTRMVMQGSSASGTSYRGSFLGFKGTEDLGGGMALDFIVESEIQADGDGGVTGQAAPTPGVNSGAGLFGNNESSLALTTAVGRFKFGRMANVLASYVGAPDPFLGKGPGGTEQLVVNPLTSTKLNNAIRYDIKFGTMGIGYQFGMSENQDGVAGSNSGSTSVLFANYIDGPVVVMGGQAILRNYGAPTVASPNLNAGRLAVYNIFGGTYKFDAAKLHALWVTGKSRSDTASAVNSTGVALIDFRTYMLGVTVPMGAHAFKVSYVNTDDKRPFTMDANSWGLGYEYTFSKRTTLYSRLAKVSNSNGAPFGIMAGGGALVAGSTADAGTAASRFNVAAASGGLGSANRTTGATVGLVHSF